eukprot:6319970-Pyramimonas_sp.AAC.1
MQEERREVTKRATVAIRACACALGLLPPGIGEWQVPVDRNGSIPWLEYWRASPRLREERIDVPIPHEHAHLFQALGKYLGEASCHKSVIDEDYMRHLGEDLQRIIREATDIGAKSPTAEPRRMEKLERNYRKAFKKHGGEAAEEAAAHARSPITRDTQVSPVQPQCSRACTAQPSGLDLQADTAAQQQDLIVQRLNEEAHAKKQLRKKASPQPRLAEAMVPGGALETETLTGSIISKKAQKRRDKKAKERETLERRASQQKAKEEEACRRVRKQVADQLGTAEGTVVQQSLPGLASVQQLEAALQNFEKRQKREQRALARAQSHPSRT